MILKLIYMFFIGYVHISVEGFFIERFINICRSKNIVLQDLHIEKDTYLKVKILKEDFKEIRNIAKKTKCKVKIEKKVGIPFFINKYRKRKIFAISFFVIAFFIFILTRFIWNIEVIGNEKISKEEIIGLVNEYGINIGDLKSSIDVQRTSNFIMIDRNDISWIGITIKGTNVIVKVNESVEIPEIIDKEEVCDIVSNKSAIVSKIIVQNGTARVMVGDEVKEGDLLVEGIMEGEHTGIRYVHAEANIYGKKYYTKEKKELFLQNETINTGKEEKKYEICLNNFKINFNKRVSKFKNYDTISSNKKIKLFSNYYFPLQITKIINKELSNEKRKYSEEELKEKIINELETEFEEDYGISKYNDENKKREIAFNLDNDGISVKITYELQEEIGTKVKQK